MKKIVYLLALAFLSYLLLMTGCDNSLNPIDKEKGLYSIYGSLNIDEDINYIRIKDLNIPLDEEVTTDIDAEATLQNLKTGNSEVLEDTIVQFDSVNTHNFYTTMDIAQDTDYELTVERSDGRIAKATAKTPPIAATEIGPTGETCYTPITLSFNPVHEEDRLDISIGFEIAGNLLWGRVNMERDENSPEKVFFRFTPKDILDDRFNPMVTDPVCCFQLSSTTFYVRYNHFGPDFGEGAETDTLNIPGGHGTFGGMYDRSFSFEIDTSQVLENPPCLEDEQ